MMGRGDTTTMKRRRHTPEQVIRKPAEGEKLLGQGRDLAEGFRHLEITDEPTYIRPLL